MSKCLQVTLSDSVYLEIQRLARSRHISTAEWVRQALGLARRREQARRAGTKLAVIRAAVEHEFPSGDIESMLGEIESGYSHERNRKG